MSLLPGSDRPGSLDDYRWLDVANDSGEVIPSHALLRFAGVDDDGRIVVDKPDADSLPFLLVNGPLPIAIGGTGAATYDEPAPVAYDDADTPAVGDTWGSESGSWLLTGGQTGWRVMSEGTGYGTVLAGRDGNGGTGVAWSTTVAGILTTTAQTGGGRKTAGTGTGTGTDKRGGWHTEAEQADGSPDTSTSMYVPYSVTYTATDAGVDVGGFTISVTALATGDYASPADHKQIVTRFTAIHGAGVGSGLFSMLYAPTGTASVNKVFAAGTPGYSGGNEGAFGVFRNPSGTQILHPGIDRDFAAGDRPIVRGGIVVGYIDAIGSHFGPDNRTATPSTASLTLTTFPPTATVTTTDL